MKYNKEEQEIINNWLDSVGASYIKTKMKTKAFVEYKDGQLLEIAKAKKDSIFTWDNWQHAQALMGMELSLEIGIRIAGILWENNIDIQELETETSKQYYKEMKL